MLWRALPGIFSHFRDSGAIFATFPPNKPFGSIIFLGRIRAGSRPEVGPAPTNIFVGVEGSGSCRKKAGAMHSEHSMDAGADFPNSISRPSGGRVAARSSRHPGFVRELFVADAPRREIADPRLERVGATVLPLIIASELRSLILRRRRRRRRSSGFCL